MIEPSVQHLRAESGYMPGLVFVAPASRCCDGRPFDGPLTVHGCGSRGTLMERLTRDDLFTLEAYATQRATLRKTALAHKRVRTLHLGANVTLLFEDKIT